MLRLNPFFRLGLPVTDAEGNATISVHAPIRGNGLLTSVVRCTDDQSLFTFLETLTSGSGERATVDVPAKLKHGLCRLGILVDADMMSRTVEFLPSLTPESLEHVPRYASRRASVPSDLIVNPEVRTIPSSGNTACPSAVIVPDPILGTESTYDVTASELGRLQVVPAQGGCHSQTEPLLKISHLSGILVSRAVWDRRGAEKSGFLSRHSSQFASDGYTLIEGLINPMTTAALRRYYRDLVSEGFVKLGDGQVNNRFAQHNEPISTRLHASLTGVVSELVGERVRPSYSYFASYRPGATLARHVDRKQCEYSISLLVDYSPEPDDFSNWPLVAERADGRPFTDGRSVHAIYQRLGDGILYAGRKLIHSRDALATSHTSTSIFFHFVPYAFTDSVD
jgi:hypothetical protein